MTAYLLSGAALGLGAGTYAGIASGSILLGLLTYGVTGAVAVVAISLLGSLRGGDPDAGGLVDIHAIPAE